MIDMGLPDDVLWSLTLPLFGKLWERHRAVERQKDRRSGEIAATIAETNRNTQKRPHPFTWLDFFPEHREPEKPQTEDDMLAVMNMMVARKKAEA